VSDGERAVPTVTVAVVSWNTRELLLRCLSSLASEAETGRVRVCVVDNASSDGSAQAARAHAPWADVIEAGSNLGFGAAVNLAARRSSSPWLACANADVALAPGALDAMLAAGADPAVGCVAPRLVLEDGSTQHSVYPFPTVPFTAAFNLGLQRVSRAFGDRVCLEGFWDPERSRAVPWAIAAFLLIRRAAFDAVGGFDEHRWMYAEDLDLGWRLHEAGWITRYEPRARVRHSSGAATKLAFGADRRARVTRETYAVVRSRRGPLRALVTAAMNVAGAAARVALGATLAWGSERRRAAVRNNWSWLAAHVSGARRPASRR
jgi:GT2 family glycosyltransferase